MGRSEHLLSRNCIAFLQTIKCIASDRILEQIHVNGFRDADDSVNVVFTLDPLAENDGRPMDHIPESSAMPKDPLVPRVGWIVEHETGFDSKGGDEEAFNFCIRVEARSLHFFRSLL